MNNPNIKSDVMDTIGRVAQLVSILKEHAEDDLFKTQEAVCATEKLLSAVTSTSLIDWMTNPKASSIITSDDIDVILTSAPNGEELFDKIAPMLDLRQLTSLLEGSFFKQLGKSNPGKLHTFMVQSYHKFDQSGQEKVAAAIAASKATSITFIEELWEKMQRRQKRSFARNMDPSWIESFEFRSIVKKRIADIRVLAEEAPWSLIENIGKFEDKIFSDHKTMGAIIKLARDKTGRSYLPNDANLGKSWNLERARTFINLVPLIYQKAFICTFNPFENDKSKEMKDASIFYIEFLSEKAEETYDKELKEIIAQSILFNILPLMPLETVPEEILNRVLANVPYPYRSIYEMDIISGALDGEPTVAIRKNECPLNDTDAINRIECNRGRYTGCGCGLYDTIIQRFDKAHRNDNTDDNLVLNNNNPFALTLKIWKGLCGTIANRIIEHETDISKTDALSIMDMYENIENTPDFVIEALCSHEKICSKCIRRLESPAGTCNHKFVDINVENLNAIDKHPDNKQGS